MALRQFTTAALSAIAFSGLFNHSAMAYGGFGSPVLNPATSSLFKSSDDKAQTQQPVEYTYNHWLRDNYNSPSFQVHQKVCSDITQIPEAKNIDTYSALDALNMYRCLYEQNLKSYINAATIDEIRQANSFYAAGIYDHFPDEDDAAKIQELELKNLCVSQLKKNNSAITAQSLAQCYTPHLPMAESMKSLLMSFSIMTLICFPVAWLLGGSMPGSRQPKPKP